MTTTYAEYVHRPGKYKYMYRIAATVDDESAAWWPRDIPVVWVDSLTGQIAAEIADLESVYRQDVVGNDSGQGQDQDKVAVVFDRGLLASAWRVPYLRKRFFASHSAFVAPDYKAE